MDQMGKRSRRAKRQRANKYAPRAWARYRRWDPVLQRSFLIEGRWNPVDRLWEERECNWAPSAPLYFAYGSNLNVAQMARRAPDAVKFSSLVLPGWALKFRGVADIVPERGASVQGGLWRITGADEAELDVYEGVRSGLYVKHYFDVVYTRVGDTSPTSERVLVYIMGSDRSEAAPWTFYLNTIRQGYADFGLDESCLNAAVAAAPKFQPYVHKSYAAQTPGRNSRTSHYASWLDDEWLDAAEDDGYPGHSHHRYVEDIMGGGYARRQARLAEEEPAREESQTEPPNGYSGAWPQGFENDWDGE